MKPFRAYLGVEALDVTPPRLFVGVGVVVDVVAHSKYVVRSECLFYGSRDGCLGFSLWEVVGDKGRANPELRGIASALVASDAHL